MRAAHAPARATAVRRFDVRLLRTLRRGASTPEACLTPSFAAAAQPGLTKMQTMAWRKKQGIVLKG